MVSNTDPNVQMLVDVARRLGRLCDDLVFVGGAVVGLLLSDSGVPDIRRTLDVDAIVEVTSRVDYYLLQEKLRAAGFSESTDSEVICRWQSGGLILDVMPTDPAILGFSNPWYSGAIEHAQEIVLQGTKLRVISAPYFIATKLEAFHGRGKDDFIASPDLEDIVTVISGRSELVDEVRGVPEDLRAFLAREFSNLIGTREFHDFLPGKLPQDETSQMRVDLVIQRMETIASIA